MIMPPGHQRRSADAPGRRDRGLLAVASGILAALIVVLVIALASHSPTSRRGCVYATVPSSTGALTIQGCGAKARRICADVALSGAFTSLQRAAVIPACRQAGLSTRRPS